MATLLEHTVAPSGGDYTTLDAAVDHLVATHANLVGTDNYAEIKIQGSWSSSDTAAVTVNGLTVDATRYLRIYTDASNRAAASGWSTSKYNLSVSNAIAILISDDFVKLDGIQIEVPAGDSNSDNPIYINAIAAANAIDISNCRMRIAAGASKGAFCAESADTDLVLRMWNCVMEVHASNAGTAGGFKSSGALTAKLYNCVIYGFPRGINGGATGTVFVYDSAVLNNTDDFYMASGTFGAIDYCASDDNDGTNNVAEDGGGADWTGDFTDGSAGNWTLLSTSNLVGAAGEAGSAIFSTDIDGNTRSDWDVGVYEYIAPVTGYINEIYLVLES